MNAETSALLPFGFVAQTKRDFFFLVSPPSFPDIVAFELKKLSH